MRPSQLAKDSEHSQQVALFAWCAVAKLHGFDVADAYDAGAKLPAPDPLRPVAVPALEWFHAIPNGGSRGDDEKSRAIRGGQLKAEADFIRRALYRNEAACIEAKEGAR